MGGDLSNIPHPFLRRDVVRCGGAGGGVRLRGGGGGGVEVPPTVSALPGIAGSCPVLLAKRRWRAPAPPFFLLFFSPDFLGRYFLEYD